MTKAPILICGGAGFIGTNLADRLMSEGQRVLVYDNLSREGVSRNLDWLGREHGDLLDFEKADIRNLDALGRCVKAAKAVFHLAAQTAVTTSVVDPADDFQTNAVGTFNLLEQLRLRSVPVPFVFTSTNKVYGNLEDVMLRRNGSRYEPQNPDVLARGISEDRPLSFHSPYGCSKGAADQYVLDYSRTYRLPNVVFRMSCIYGPHQCGTEDQGWVAHFLIQALKDKAIVLYGDGLQVRDILFVDDLVNAFLLANEQIEEIAGNAFNIGGGPANTTSLLELIGLIEEYEERRSAVRFEPWRVGDQRYYVSDTGRFREATGWTPRVGVREGIQKLHNWLVTGNSTYHAVPALQGGAQ